FRKEMPNFPRIGPRTAGSSWRQACRAPTPAAGRMPTSTSSIWHRKVSWFHCWSALGGRGGAVFAPDGRSIAFLADDSRREEVYVQPFDPEARRLTGTRHQISRGGAGLVRWPKPGRELFYLGYDYWIYAATLTGEPKRLFMVAQQA